MSSYVRLKYIGLGCKKRKDKLPQDAWVIPLSLDARSGQQDGGARAADSGRDDANLIAEVSHELRLPIANLRLLVETLLAGASEDPETLRRMLTRAHQEIERLQNLVVNLLSAEQVASSLHQLKRRWVSLEERARYCAEVVKPKAQAVGIELAIEPGWRIYANPEQLDQVLLNLVENAVKFTPPGGTVTIKSGPGPDGFSVVDTGIGMPEHEIPKIFKRFYRIDRAQSRGSTGLGLSIVKHIVDLHGAKISVQSEEGAGSTFQLEFPGPAEHD